MATRAEILNKITNWIKTNGNKEITAVQLHEILDDIANNIQSSSHVTTATISTREPLNLLEVSAGTAIRGIPLTVGQTILVSGQTIPSQNGIYTVGATAGGTLRLADYPDAASCANRIIITEYPDVAGNIITVLTLDDDGAVAEEYISSAIERRHDWQSPYDYCGTASNGTSENVETWTITRITVADDGSTTASILTNAKWTDHLTLNY